MPAATKPAPYGKTDWIDNTHNWAETDPEWIQDRLVLRWANAASRTTSGSLYSTEASDSAGKVSYLADTGLQVYHSSSWKTLLSGQYLQIATDTASETSLKHSSASSGIRLYSDNTVFADTALSVAGSKASPRVKLSTSGAEFLGTGGGYVLMAADTSTNKLVLTASGGLETVKLTVNGISTLNSTVSVSGNLNVLGSGILTAGAATFNNSSSAVNFGAGGISTTGVISTTLSLAAGNYSVSPSGFRGGGTASLITMNTNVVQVSGSQVDLKVPTGGTINFAIGSNTAKVAGWFASAAAPGSTAAPDGTIWFQI